MAYKAYANVKNATRKTAQTNPIPGENQVQNSAGGYVYELSTRMKNAGLKVKHITSAKYVARGGIF